MENLTRCGAFCALEPCRKKLFNNIENILNAAAKESEAKESGQVSLFAGLGGGSSSYQMSSFELQGTDEEYSDKEIQEYVVKDFDTLGFDCIPCQHDADFNKSNREWKIAILQTKEKSKKYYDFHFLRQLVFKDQWTYKFPWTQHPQFADSSWTRITNPFKARFGKANFKCVGCFLIAPKKLVKI